MAKQENASTVNMAMIIGVFNSGTCGIEFFLSAWFWLGCIEDVAVSVGVG